MQPFIFVQIGSNTGAVENDPIRDFIKSGWRGVLIEPVPSLFEELKKTYAGYQNLSFENVAISNRKGMAKFYRVKEHAVKNSFPIHWTDQLGTLQPEIIFKTFPFITEQDLYTIDVPCMTLQEIVDKHQLIDIDLLQIDAEGQDAPILLSIDFERFRPKMIIFEHLHMREDQFTECLFHLKIHGYSVIERTKMDTFVSKIY